MTLTLYVPHTESWWFARRADLPWLTDPHEDDGRVRHHDRDERAWPAIAATVQAVARAIAYGGHPVDEEDPAVAVVAVDDPGLAAADRRIVTSWFRAGSEAPAADPWDDGLVNGRHRLWATWRAVPDALLPVHSDLLAYLDDVTLMGPEFAATISQSALDGLRQIPPAPAESSPRFVDELRRVAREGGHDVDGLPRLVGERPRRRRWWPLGAG